MKVNTKKYGIKEFTKKDSFIVDDKEYFIGAITVCEDNKKFSIRKKEKDSISIIGVTDEFGNEVLPFKYTSRYSRIDVFDNDKICFQFNDPCDTYGPLYYSYLYEIKEGEAVELLKSCNRLKKIGDNKVLAVDFDFDEHGCTCNPIIILYDLEKKEILDQIKGDLKQIVNDDVICVEVYDRYPENHLNNYLYSLGEKKKISSVFKKIDQFLTQEDGSKKANVIIVSELVEDEKIKLLSEINDKGESSGFVYNSIDDSYFNISLSDENLKFIIDAFYNTLDEEDKIFQITMEMKDLEDNLKLSWCKETAHASAHESWGRVPLCTGQCAVTAMVVQDYFGGELIRGAVTNSNISHYWNLINGEHIDLTREQFKDVKFDSIETRTREYLESNEDTLRRYKLLKEKVENMLQQPDIKLTLEK